MSRAHRKNTRKHFDVWPKRTSWKRKHAARNKTCDDGSVTVEECRSFYPDACDGELVDVTTAGGTKQYDL